MNKDMQTRTVLSNFKTRMEGDSPHIEGRFITFGETTELCPGLYEEISPDLIINGTDIRALINHDTTLVLGRTKANTFKFDKRADGVYGDVAVNPKDSDAMNCYARVERGDVSQCSFGFNIINEETEFRDDGSIKWTIKEIELFEMSVCTFPAYESTAVQARSKEAEAIREREFSAKKLKLKEKLKGAIDA